ncbi:hypothetical protein DMN91_012972 [Ooceraea biroi]|uniref:RNA-directed DNA polymerase from mobile element jockey n=1 Tax=Ooceraea biroi TaxID=2015173 RepID=A0A3L8D3K1_OOCBI|nr:hypothetical protein DMN91_012972 [Ooceraea biroi]
MLLGTARYLNGIATGPIPQIVVDGEVVPFTDSVVYLGLTITNTLAWDRQVSAVVSRVNSTLYQFKLCKDLLPESVRRSLVTTVIFSYIDYCCTAMSDITGMQNLRLQRAVNACVRFIVQRRLDDHITPFFAQLKWLKVDERRKYLMVTLIHSVILSSRPLTLVNELTWRSDVSVRCTRASGSLLEVPACRTEQYRRSFRCFAAELWNALPQELKSLDSASRFKGELYDLFLSKRS